MTTFILDVTAKSLKTAFALDNATRLQVKQAVQFTCKSVSLGRFEAAEVTSRVTHGSTM